MDGFFHLIGKPLDFFSDRIIKTTIFRYSVGHILNDLCSACWFTYLIIFLTEVKQYSESFAGILMLVGQVSCIFNSHA